MEYALRTKRANKLMKGGSIKTDKKVIIIDTELGLAICTNCNGFVFPIRDANKNFNLSGDGKCSKCGEIYAIKIERKIRRVHKRSNSNKKIELSIKNCCFNKN